MEFSITTIQAVQEAQFKSRKNLLSNKQYMKRWVDSQILDQMLMPTSRSHNIEKLIAAATILRVEH